MSDIYTMNDAYPDGFTGDGIFTDLQDSTHIPWTNLHINATLDKLYYAHSGNKTCSDVVSKRISKVTGHLASIDRGLISLMVKAMFNVRWNKLYETMSLEYNPIENYRMTESEEIEKHSENVNEDRGTITTQNNLTETDTGTIRNDGDNEYTNSGTVGNSGTMSNVNSVYGFNSSNAVNSDETENSNSNTETRNISNIEDLENVETRNLTKTNSGTVTDTHNLTVNNENDDASTRELTRYGNIGVTTSQQMIESERRLWEWNFFSVVFNDIDSILCLPIYSYETECD